MSNFYSTQSNPVYVQAYAVPGGEQDKLLSPPISAPPPSAAIASTLDHLPPTQHEAAIKEFLTSYKWPIGLQETFIQNLNKIPIRFFICDDSGSMSNDDGHCLVQFDGVTRFRSCSRWKELSTALSFHAKLARIAHAPTQFRLLNGAAPLLIGGSEGPNISQEDEENFQLFLTLLQQSPSGGTPLCAHIREVVQQITAIAPLLRAKGQKACVVIATDGESSDGDVVQALKPLEHLPAWVVIRLCTDEEQIVNYWNNIDNDLELQMDVLDDLEGEAKEIESNNPWLSYAEPLHRLREFGIPIKEIDLLDEKSLNLDQVRLFASLLFGGHIDNYPHPQEEWKEFQEMITIQNKKNGFVFSPVTKRMTQWFDVRRMPRKTSLCEAIVPDTSGCILM